MLGQVGTNVAGLVAALSAILCTAVYQIWVGAKQKELGTGSMQLMHQFQPHATVLLVLLVVALEPLGLPHTPRAFEEDTIMGYKYTPLAVGAILITAVLGLVVSLSTFLVIGATSSVTFNVVRRRAPRCGIACKLSQSACVHWSCGMWLIVRLSTSWPSARHPLPVARQCIAWRNTAVCQAR